MSDRNSRALDKLSANLAPLFAEEDFELAKKTLVEACRATRRVRGGKDPKTGSYMYDDVPDYAIRVAAACKVVEWVAGKPVSRSITTTVPSESGQESSEGFMTALMADPEARASLRSTFDKLVEAAEKAKPMEIVVSKPLPESPPSTS